MLPALPLAIYSAALGAMLILVFVSLLRRRARPGSLLASGLMVFPLGQLAIERLRQPLESRGAVMTIVLLAMMAADLLVLAASSRTTSEPASRFGAGRRRRAAIT